MSPLFTHDGKLLVVDGKLATSEDCCCDKRRKICWAHSRGILFPDAPEDLVVNNNSDLSQCKVIVDFFADMCPGDQGYAYFNPQKIGQFVTDGGLYITNCEWNNCRDDPDVCDPTGEPFNEHMDAIGANLSRGRGTISVSLVYNSLGSKLFQGCNIAGNATAEITGGTALLNGPAAGSECPLDVGGTCCAGSKVGTGAVVAFGDSNVEINAAIRDNILNNPVANLF